MLAIVGLGNPSSDHKYNRHNVGFMVLDSIKEKRDLENFRKKHDSLIINTKINSYPIILIKPQTYMNRSWISIINIINFYKLNIEDFIVIHDDLDIDLGKIKTKIGGGNGGHNGLKGIDENIGKNYRRIRIGIGHPGKKDLVNKHVLSNFRKSEYKIISMIIENITTQFEKLIENINNNVNQDLSELIDTNEVK